MLKVGQSPLVTARSVRCVALILALGVPPAVSAQAVATGSISGRVLREDDGRPLPGSRVQLVGFFPPRFPFARGDFRFDRLPPGQYRLRVLYIGFVPLDTTVNVAAGSVQRLTINMRALPVQLTAVTIRELVKGCDDGSASSPRENGAPCTPPKKQVRPCGFIAIVSIKTLMCTSTQILARKEVHRQQTFLGHNAQILQAAQRAVTFAGLITEKVVQLNDATWLILGRKGAKGDDTAWARIEVEEVGAHDTTVRVSMTALAALGTRKESDDARALLESIGRILQ